MTGFPSWTLWGMGLSALGALFFVTLALMGQSPRLLRRLGLDVYRLDLRVRAFTGYAFAFLLLVFGFFLAGVPLGTPPAEPVAQVESTTTPTRQSTPDVAGTLTRSAITSTVTATAGPTLTATRPASGAFGGVASATPTATATRPEVVVPDIPSPTPSVTLSAGEGLTATVVVATTAVPTNTPGPTTTATSTLTPTPSPTATPTSTPTPSPTPTATPTPSLTPTPVTGPTGTVDSDGANIWLYRSPGGQEMFLLSDGTTVILLDGHASQGGELWREVETLQGVSGWLQSRYLAIAP